jgi:hypothetical protein
MIHSCSANDAEILRWQGYEGLSSSSKIAWVFIGNLLSAMVSSVGGGLDRFRWRFGLF